ncbi:MAG: tRNA 2-thiouridine(34) synthase MnmA [Nitrospinota bacterium]|nr:tRNA 2-thiouridine(34) synthase MnmA [Nitrospinota bacterium]MDH5756774.1 tRNA 2-thiouridine(34) synthase MnmA [Nitrospinota bacterium]
MDSQRIISAMSGGVDSSVATAVLVGQGRDVVGVTMKIWEAPAMGPRVGGCCSMDDADDARRVCDSLGIPHYTLNAQSIFKEKVVDYFTGQYYAGKTPNPCIPCNHALKFDHLFNQGAAVGAGRVATGHYSGIGTLRGRHTVTRAADRAKDQSYYLFSIPPQRLAHIDFPLADIDKERTREMARSLGLPVAEKKESQEICFVPDNDYKSFIQGLPGAEKVGEGEIVDLEGKVVGHHGGYIGYTVGQRRGLGIAAPEPSYVLRVDPDSNRLVVGRREDLYSNALLASAPNWYIPPMEIADLDLTAKIRSRSEDSPAKVTVASDGRFTVEFATPQLSITPGQAVVIYHGEHVVGGGWIERAL